MPLDLDAKGSHDRDATTVHANCSARGRRRIVQRASVATRSVSIRRTSSQTKAGPCSNLRPVDELARNTAPRCIDSYLVEVENFGTKFKIDLKRLLYRCNAKATVPPEFHCSQCEIRRRGSIASQTLFDALNHHDPHLLDALRN
jgi:hypothetical protein